MKKSKPLIESRLILGAQPPDDIAQAIRESENLAPDAVISPCVFEVQVCGQTRYCCWSGGRMMPGEDGNPEPEFTPMGHVAFAALLSLPFLSKKKIIIQQIVKGRTPIRDKVINAFLASRGTKAPICFVGDLAGELDGEMFKSVNMAGFVELSECIERNKGNA
jgi:hypothetical protein